jgi:PAS domain S-box-containing protein
MKPWLRLDRIWRAARRFPAARSLRAYVVILVVACIIPMVAFSAFAVLRYANAQRESNNRQILNTARAMSAAMDVEFKTAEASLAALATSPALRDGNLAEFYGQAQQVAGQHHAWVVLVEPEGRVILNTLVPMGGPPRQLKSSDLAGSAAATRTVQISNVFYGATPDRPQVSMYLPVVGSENKVTHVLMMSYDLQELNQVLLDQNLPTGWWVMLVDREHRIILRNRNVGQHAGETVSDALVALMSRSGEAVYSGTSFQGVPATVALTRSGYTGWTLAVVVPSAQIGASVNESLRDIGLAAIAMLALGLLFAGVVGRRMAAALRRLSTSALAVGQGAAVPPARTGLAEVDDVLGALETSSARLRRRSNQRDEAERSLRHSEQRFRDIAEIAADWIWETDRAHRFTYFSGAEPDVTDDRDPDISLGTTRWEFAGADAELDERWRQHKADLDARRPIRGFRYSVILDGREMHYVVNGKPVFDESGEFLGYRGTSANETEVIEARQRAEQAEAQLQDAVDSISEGFIIFDRDDRLVMCNERYRALFNTSLSRLGMRATFEEIVRAGVIHGQISEAIGREEDWIAERLRRHREADGVFEEKLGDGSVVLVTERRMRSGGTAGLRIDITALKQAQAALRESEQQLDRAQRIAHIGSWEVDLKTGEVVWSKEMHRIRGLSPESFRPTLANAEDFTHPDDRPSVMAWVQQWRSGHRPAALEYRIRRADGAIRRVRVEGESTSDDEGKLVKITGTMQDVTESRETEAQRRILEDQLHHSQKLEALGTLAGGIAHDLNNTLVPVLAMAKLGLKRSEPRSAARESFEMIYQAGLRARDLVKQVLAFSRKDTVNRQPFRLHEVVEEALAMLRLTIPATITIERAIDPVPPVLGDPSQLHQVVVNLVTNAVHAMGIRLGIIAVAVTALPGGAPGEPGFVRLSVRDTGCGMDEATQKRIFDPFFTTKAVGEGSGLGLSVVHGIVTGHGGTVRVESRPDQGTRFVIDLPLADQPIAMEEAVPA